MTVRLAGDQVQGARRRQEDALRFESLDGGSAALAVLADGLGGHPAGDVASHEAANTVCKVFLAMRGTAPGSPADWMREAVVAANRRIVGMQEEDENLMGMATTLVAAYIEGERLWAACVGDSYLLLLHDHELILVNELHKLGGGLTSTVGFNLNKVDLAEGMEVAVGDRLLLASDGIDSLDRPTLQRLLSEADDPQGAVNGLLREVENRAYPFQDNATLVAAFL